MKCGESQLCGNPSFEDGVIINFAPLWRLVAHKTWRSELKATWDALTRGEFDWTHLAMRLWPDRVVPKCATDRSLAIAHMALRRSSGSREMTASGRRGQLRHARSKISCASEPRSPSRRLSRICSKPPPPTRMAVERVFVGLQTLSPTEEHADASTS